MPQDITEQLTLEATSTDGAGGLLVEFITPGWGASGYYSADVVEAAAPLFAVGTHLYLDHPTATEDLERPVRSVKDLAAVITEAGVWKDGGIRGKVKPFGPYRELLLDEDFATNIGLSIRASASDIVVGEAEGRRGPIIEGLVDLKSVDFVTRAGRGGRVLQVLESANDVTEARNIGQWVESRIHRDFTVMADDMAGDGRLTREERIGLSSAIGDALAAFVGALEANQPQLYLRDIWADPQDTVAAALEAAKNVTATRPDSKKNPLKKLKEHIMSNIEIDEAEHRSLVEASGRVPTLESERDTEREGRIAAERERDQLRARESAVTHARTRVTTANASLPASTVDRIVEAATRTVPLTEAGQLDTTALDAAVDTSRTTEETYLAGLAEAAGVGSISGFGGTSTETKTVSESDIDNAVGSAFGRPVKEA